MNAHSQRLLALRQDLPLKPIEKTRIRRGFGFYINHSFHLYITILIIITVLFGNIAFQAVGTVRQARAELPLWLNTIQTIKDLSPKNQQIAWSTLTNDIQGTVSPAFAYVGLDSLVDQDISKTTELMESWYSAAIPLSDYSFNDNGLEYIGPGKTKYFTDDLETFFFKAETLLPRTRNLLNSFWYYRLAGYLTLNSRIIGILDQLDSVLSLMDSIVNNKSKILDVLGHNIRKTFIVFNQNTGESRPMGGFMGSYFTIDIIKGLMEIKSSKSIYQIDDNKPKPMVTHPIISQVSLYQPDKGSEGGIRNLNYLTCFPDTARMINRELNQLKDISMDTDGVVFINSKLLLDLFPDDFVISVPGYGTFNTANILFELDRLTSVDPKPEDRDNVKEAISPIFKVFIQSIPQIVARVGVTHFMKQVIKSLQTRNLLVWLKNDYVENLLNRLGLDGSQTCGKSNVISPLHINLTADKRDSITSNQYAISAKPVWGGYQISVNYQQTLPSSIYLPRGFNFYTGRQYFGLQVPPESWDYQISSNSPFQAKGLDDFYSLYVQQRYQSDYTEPEEYRIINGSINNIPNGYTYLQPDGTKVVGGIFWTQERTSGMTITFKVPSRVYQSMYFYGQPGVNTPELSAGNGIRFVGHDDTVLNERYDIEKGVSIKLI